MKLNVLRADPSGNITLFVLDPVSEEERASTAARLMALPGSDVEQVGFLCPPRRGGQGRLEMAGGEFCGNASRAFGMLTAQRLGETAQVRVEVSGCEPLVTVDVDWTNRTARARMPLPRSVSPAHADGYPGTLVDLVGIAHLVVEDIPPNPDFFQRAEPLFEGIPDLEAYGVIFLDTRRGTMTPLVKVPAAGTLVWEGSCGSGTLAAAIAQSRDTPDGSFVRDYVQPAGVIWASVLRQNGTAASAWISGPVRLDPPIEIEL